MKKLSTFLCALTVAAGAAFSPVFAAPTQAEGDKTVDETPHAALKANTETGMSQIVNVQALAGVVYDVDIIWGDMKFRYNSAWHPNSHTYGALTDVSEDAGNYVYANFDNAGQTGWEATKGEGLNGNQVVIMNHSNAEIEDEVQFDMLETLIDNNSDVKAHLAHAECKFADTAAGYKYGAKESSGEEAAQAGLTVNSTLYSADETNPLILDDVNATSASITTLTLQGSPDRDTFKGDGAKLGDITITLTDVSNPASSEGD